MAYTCEHTKTHTPHCDSIHRLYDHSVTYTQTHMSHCDSLTSLYPHTHTLTHKPHYDSMLSLYQPTVMNTHTRGSLWHSAESIQVAHAHSQLTVTQYKEYVTHKHTQINSSLWISAQPVPAQSLTPPHTQITVNKSKAYTGTHAYTHTHHSLWVKAQ